MASSQTMLVLSVVMVLSTVVFGATAGDVLTDDPDADQLVEAVVSGPIEFETLHGVRSVNITTSRVAPGRSQSTVITEEVWLDSPNQSRIEVIGVNSSSVAAKGDVLVINRSTLKRYKADHDVMTVDRNWQPGDHLLDHELRLDDYEVEYLGTDTVAGRETHVVEIEPAPNASVKAALTFHLGSSNFGVMTVRAETDENATFDYTTTWWIDVETMYPLKERVEWQPAAPREHPGNLKKKVQTVEYRLITFNGSIPDDRFTFTPPNGTEVHEAAEPLDIDTVEDADRAAPFAVPDPPLPDRFDLVQASGDRLKDNVTVSLLFGDGEELAESDTVRIEWSERATKYADKRIVDDNVGSINGTVVEYASGPILVYDCGDVRIEISADIEARDDLDFAIELAEAMGCR